LVADWDKPDGQAQGGQDVDEPTDFGTSVMCLFLAGFFVFCALYLGPYPDLAVGDLTVPVSALVKWGCYILAGVCFVLFVGFWGVAMQRSPEMGTFFKSIWGGGERGWQYASHTAWLLGAAFLLHLCTALLFYLSGLVRWLSWLKYVGWVVQWPVVILALFASVMLGYAFDAFFIKPILQRASEGGEPFRELVQTVRVRGTVIVPLLIALITLYVEIFR
jgi:hypothetical protein